MSAYHKSPSHTESDGKVEFRPTACAACQEQPRVRNPEPFHCKPISSSMLQLIGANVAVSTFLFVCFVVTKAAKTLKSKTIYPKSQDPQSQALEPSRSCHDGSGASNQSQQLDDEENQDERAWLEEPAFEGFWSSKDLHGVQGFRGLGFGVLGF